MKTTRHRLPGKPLGAPISYWGERLRQVREARGETQRDLAKRAGVTQQLISHLESGRTSDSTRLVDIAKCLGVTAHWLRTGTLGEADLAQLPLALLMREIARRMAQASPILRETVLSLVTRCIYHPGDCAEIERVLGILLGGLDAGLEGGLGGELGGGLGGGAAAPVDAA